MRKLWEILVPTIRPDGRAIRTRFHRVWDDKVRTISGGLTVLQPARGQWVSPDGELFTERMIPVRLLATDEEIRQIIQMTLTYYDQRAVLCYVISSEVIMTYREPKKE